MIGLSALALELTCEWLENEYVKMIGEDNRLVHQYKSESDWDNFRVSILDDKCSVFFEDTKRTFSISKTESTYRCRDRSKKDTEGFTKGLYFRDNIKIDRYTGKAERVFNNGVGEFKNIFQCEKSEKKF